MNELIKKFDGYKFRQSMKQYSSDNVKLDYFADDYELSKETILILATEDVARMWHHLWNKLSIKIKRREKK